MNIDFYEEFIDVIFCTYEIYFAIDDNFPLQLSEVLQYHTLFISYSNIPLHLNDLIVSFLYRTLSKETPHFTS